MQVGPSLSLANASSQQKLHVFQVLHEIQLRRTLNHVFFSNICHKADLLSSVKCSQCHGDNNRIKIIKVIFKDISIFNYKHFLGGKIFYFAAEWDGV